MVASTSEMVRGLLQFLNASPTPYHAVVEAAQRLDSAGFRQLEETQPWELESGDRCYVVRAAGSLLAFTVGAGNPADCGVRMIGAHTDSPNLRIKPCPDVSTAGYRQLAVEPYGGLLLHTWLDRDLGLAGRVVAADGAGQREFLVDLARPLLRVPNLAIHLQRELASEGLKLNRQSHAVPVLGLADAPTLADLLVEELAANGAGELETEDILAFDLMAYDLQPAVLAGANGEFIQSARLDNLASCHAALTALLDSTEDADCQASRLIVLYDHEEVGSRSSQGAGGTFLGDVLERIAALLCKEPDARARMLAASSLVSADMAHAVHPNYTEKHEPGHKPLIGGGPVLKHNVSQAYATDGRSAARFVRLAEQQGASVQHFVARSDMGCGSTIGPITAARNGVATVDVGNPMLSMHSCREMAGTADVEPMIRILTAHLGQD